MYCDYGPRLVAWYLPPPPMNFEKRNRNSKNTMYVVSIKINDLKTLSCRDSQLWTYA
jgi:hypothetical protein